MCTPSRCAVVCAALGMLAGCAGPLLSPEDRVRACHAAVVDATTGAEFVPNPFSGPAGVAKAAASGATAALYAGRGFLLMMPVMVAVGAVGAKLCAEAGALHPDADARFERMLTEASAARALPQALQAALDASRPDCVRPAGAQGPAEAPQLVVQVEKVTAGMDCLIGSQSYWIEARWRASASGRSVAERTTRCTHVSYRQVDEWFAHPEDAASEIGRVLAATGRRIAGELAGPPVRNACRLRSTADGAVEVQ